MAPARAVSNISDRAAAAPFGLKLPDPERLSLAAAAAREEARADAVHSGNVGSRPLPVGEEGAAQVLDTRRHHVGRGELGPPGDAAAAQPAGAAFFFNIVSVTVCGSRAALHRCIASKGGIVGLERIVVGKVVTTHKHASTR